MPDPAFDTSIEWDTTHVASPATGLITVGAGSDPIILLHVCDDDPNETLTGFSTDQSGDGAGGDGEFVKIVEVDVAGGGAAGSMWVLAPASVASHTITPAFSNTTGKDVSVIASSYHNVDPTTPYGGTDTATGTGTAVSVTATTASGELVVDCVAQTGISGATVGADQTLIRDNPAGGAIACFASHQAGVDGGVMTWTLNVIQNWSAIAISLKPVVASDAGKLLGSRNFGPGSPLLGGPGKLLQRSTEKIGALQLQVI